MWNRHAFFNSLAYCMTCPFSQWTPKIDRVHSPFWAKSAAILIMAGEISTYIFFDSELSMSIPILEDLSGYFWISADLRAYGPLGQGSRVLVRLGAILRCGQWDIYSDGNPHGVPKKHLLHGPRDVGKFPTKPWFLSGGPINPHKSPTKPCFLGGFSGEGTDISTIEKVFEWSLILLGNVTTGIQWLRHSEREGIACHWNSSSDGWW